jgi:PAS domain S-box-containing protein
MEKGVRAEQIQAATYRISEVAQTSKSLDEMYRRIHAIIGDLMPARNFYVALYDAPSDLLHFPYYSDEIDQDSSAIRPGRSPSGYVLRTGNALLLTPQLFDTMVAEGELELIGENSVDWLGVPLKTDGETIGVMVVQTYSETTRYTESDRDVLSFVSNQVAMAIERKCLEERIAGLGYLKQQLIAPGTLSEKLQLITSTVVDMLGADFARIWITRDGDRCSSGCRHSGNTEGPEICPERSRCLHLVASSGRYTHLDGGHSRVPLGAYKIGGIASGKESSFITNDLAANSRIDRNWAESLGLLSFAGHRIISKEGNAIGVLAFFSKRKVVSHEAGLIEDLANTTSQVILAGAAEEALHETERIMSTLLSNLPGMAYRCRNDINWTMEFVSQGSVSLTGFEPDQLTGNAEISYGDLIYPEDRELVWQGVQAAVAAREPFELIYRIKVADGSIKWVWEQGRGIFRGDGAMASIEGFITDISKRKRAEEEMIALQQQLRQSQKMEAVGRLAGGIAHDFNNLLTVIRGYGELALMDLNPDSPLRQSIEVISRAANRATELTRQLLAFSRRQVLDLKVTNLNELIRNLDQMLHRIIGEDIEVRTELAEGLGSVKVDAGQIEQVILNLAVNARDAMPSGGRISISTASVELDGVYGRAHAGMKSGKWVMLSVSDTGHGMPPEVRERIFEPFFTTKEKGKGTGLGLSTVFGIVKQSDGFIWCYSEPGLGTTFKIYLPYVNGTAQNIETSAQSSAKTSRGDETILVVEDDDSVRALAVDILSGCGYQVLAASGGEAAIRLYKEQSTPVHLILTDVVMPRMSGTRLIEELRPNGNTRVIYMSGYTDKDVVSQGLLQQGLNYLQKPFSTSTLAETVRNVLDRGRTLRKQVSLPA